MRTIVALMTLGALTAATYAYAVIARLPEESVASTMSVNPVMECLISWHCAGPVAIHQAPSGEKYGEYVCDHGFIFLKNQGPVL